MYELGQKITVDTHLERVSRFVQEQNESPRKQEWKIWEERVLKNPINGIVIGIRNLSNGRNHWDSEAGTDYEPKTHFKALIVSYHLNRKPILVRMMDSNTSKE